VNNPVGILGAGGWGTALAITLNANGHQVTLWEFDKQAASRLKRRRENKTFLPGIAVPKEIEITHNLPDAVQQKTYILVTLPSHVVRDVCLPLRSLMSASSIVISGTKGIENTTGKRISEILIETLPMLSADRIVVLSGPSHAEELAKMNPTVVVTACVNEITSRSVQKLFMNPFFRLYTSTDVIGVELGGALKNVIAIAAGIVDGLELGDNLKAALINRGLVEITRLGHMLGADPLTFAGLSGMGDLIVTCTSRHSRNRFVGEQIGKGRSLQQILNSMVMVAEGVRTTRSAMELANAYHVDMPITSEVYKVLFNGKNPRQAVTDLMTREAKAEDWG
jgi:glycerol-3-phosphate dehydrogenase (NAD(P)+)